MKYLTHNDTVIDTRGASLQGYLTATYSELVDAFGEPSKYYDDSKSDAEWDVEFEDGTVAKVYNWKSGPNYLGKDGTPVKKITDWNVGARNPAAVEMIEQALLDAQV
jgi:hypothetical protein